MTTARETACFEAGIKLGTLYHQFVGTPVTAETASGLAAAMAAAVEQQPACRSAEVSIDVERIEEDANRYGYAELTGRHLDATVVVETDGASAEARLDLENGYPMMRLTDVSGFE